MLHAGQSHCPPEEGRRREGHCHRTTFRRLVAKTLARQFSRQVEAACAPFQFALSTRAGVDCVGHVVRATTDADCEATLLSIDGVGAYDHVLVLSRQKLLEVPGLRPLLPFVRSIYARPSRYVWQDDVGQRHEVHQHEGGEQGVSCSAWRYTTLWLKPNGR